MHKTLFTCLLVKRDEITEAPVDLRVGIAIRGRPSRSERVDVSMCHLDYSAFAMVKYVLLLQLSCKMT